MVAVTRKRAAKSAKKAAPAKVEQETPDTGDIVDTKVATFVVEKETPGTMRFKEQYDSDAGELPLCGTIYIKKTAWRELGEPTNLRVTVEAE